MNMKKKNKKVKKYAYGGPLNDRGATGEVGTITKAAGRAGDYLSTAGKAIGSGSGSGTSTTPMVAETPEFPFYMQPPAPSTERLPTLKKGGKVKKKKSPTIKARGVGRAVQKKIRPAKMVKM